MRAILLVWGVSGRAVIRSEFPSALLPHLDSFSQQSNHQSNELEARRRQDDENRQFAQSEHLADIEHKPQELQPPVYRLDTYDYPSDSLRPEQFDFVGTEPPKGSTVNLRSPEFGVPSQNMKPVFTDLRGSRRDPPIATPAQSMLESVGRKYKRAQGTKRYGPVDSWWEGGNTFLVVDAAYGGEGVASFPHTKWGLPEERSFASTVITFDVDFQRGWDSYTGPHGGITIGTEAGRLAQWTYHAPTNIWSPGVDCVIDWLGGWVNSHRVYWTQWGERFENLTPDRSWNGNGATSWKIEISSTGAATFTAGPVHFSFTMKLRDGARLGFWVYPYTKMRIGNLKVQRLGADKDLKIGDTISLADIYWRTQLSTQDGSDRIIADGKVDSWSGDPLSAKKSAQFTIFDGTLWGLPFVQLKTFQKTTLSCEWNGRCKHATSRLDLGVPSPNANLLSTRFLLIKSYDGTWALKWGGSNCYEWGGGWCYNAANYVQTFYGYEMRLTYFDLFYDWMTWERYWVHKWRDAGGCPPGQLMGINSEPLRCDDCPPGCVCIASQQYPCPSGTIQPNFGSARCQPCGDFQVTYNSETRLTSGNSSSTSRLPGGQGWLQLGSWRMGEYDPATFVISNDNGGVYLVLSSLGNAAWWPQISPSLTDRPLQAFSTGVVFGDRFIEFNQRWRLGMPEIQSLTVAHSSGPVAIKWGSGGTRVPGPATQGSTWDRGLNCNGFKYGPGFLELGGAWRISYSPVSLTIHSGSNPSAESFVHFGQTLVSTPTNCATVTGLESPFELSLDLCDKHCRSSVGCKGFDYCNSDEGCAPGVGIAKSPKGSCWLKTSTCTANTIMGDCSPSGWCLYRYVSDASLACLDDAKPHIFNATSGGFCCSAKPVNNACPGAVCALSQQETLRKGFPRCVSSLGANYQTTSQGDNGCPVDKANSISGAQCGAHKCSCQPGYKRQDTDPQACQACAAGKYCFLEQEMPCPMDTFNPYSGAASCQKCPPNQWTAGLEGQTSCKCIKGKYIGLNGVGCVSCPQNYECSDYLSPLCPSHRFRENGTGTSRDVPRDCLPLESANATLT